ncbi:putative MFS family arabinose efflux permease [Rhizobium sp. SG_E_25_P2]|uniref:YbfB/YjiJ family MFS transporter n=1 Tax=Rhizobium sp. SG_E_25_P2 TaxID=2879942 RepID=UPI0024750CC5|nr:YbfB/YjiJ family MFS transporter [Rhizobium sp. SG_E_25_P2]MDH6267094.1 putative MFS family arabinose efflux permease [Rhizobium sp. SG_E_25_P2]
MSSSPSAPRDYYASAAALSGAVAMAAAMGFGRFSFTPILPGMISELGLSASASGLIAAGNFTGYLAGALLASLNWATGRERRTALAALAANAALLGLMAATDDILIFTLIRFLSGVASAFAMIFTSSVVLGHAARIGGERIQSAHFGGVGLGIAASSALVFALGQIAPGAWRLDWLAGGFVSLAAFVLVFTRLPPMSFGPAVQAREPRLAWTPAFSRLILSYGLFGFGYVVTATFIVAMVRQARMGAGIEFLSWFLAGCAAALSLIVWRPLMQRQGLGGAYLAALTLEALGVAASVLLHGPIAPLLGGLLLGATFMVITAYGLRLARDLAPESPRRAFSLMTAAFGLGQIAGPLTAGSVAEWTGGFTLPSLMAAGALTLAALIAFPLRRAPIMTGT